LANYRHKFAKLKSRQTLVVYGIYSYSRFHDVLHWEAVNCCPLCMWLIVVHHCMRYNLSLKGMLKGASIGVSVSPYSSRLIGSCLVNFLYRSGFTGSLSLLYLHNLTNILIIERRSKLSVLHCWFFTNSKSIWHQSTLLHWQIMHASRLFFNCLSQFTIQNSSMLNHSHYHRALVLRMALYFYEKAVHAYI